MTTTLNPFDDPHHVARYADRAAQMVPAYRDIHRMVAVLIAERAPSDARILVLGAGGGLETKSFAEAHQGWTFDAVDPSAAMLDLAERNLGPLTQRVRMHHGYVDDAPAGPFAAATSLLTLHFLPYEKRRATATQVRQRLAPGAPFIVAHMSLARTAIGTQVPVLSPAQDRTILQEAGFSDVTEFFSAFTFRGWVGYA
ncbi:class I SAM-dependent methyltransferase [Mycolicibacterium sp.]|uniref:class I SAM-dependent methyltransferase n=1 Tax=Mycolicibacterium sp. TaxID=2320850 RepID=UPI0037C64658